MPDGFPRWGLSEEFLLPDDYEPCGQCGFDHGYEYQEAHSWHTKHDKPTTILGTTEG